MPVTITSSGGISTAVAGSAASAVHTASGGTSPYTWTYSGTIPTGTAISSAGVYSGTHAVPGTYVFKIRATDALGASAEQSHTSIVTPTTTLVLQNVGIFPRNGRLPTDRNSGLKLRDTVAECPSRYYDEACPQPIDPIAFNFLMSELVSIVNACPDLEYDCARKDNVLRAIQCLMPSAATSLPFCRSVIVASGGTWLPTTFYQSVLVDDTINPPGLWLWDCNDSIYREFPQPTVVTPVAACTELVHSVTLLTDNVPQGLSAYMQSDVGDARCREFNWIIDDITDSSGGFFVSVDAGATWHKFGSWTTIDGSGNQNPITFISSFKVTSTGLVFGNSPALIAPPGGSTATAWRFRRVGGGSAPHPNEAIYSYR